MWEHYLGKPSSRCSLLHVGGQLSVPPPPTSSSNLLLMWPDLFQLGACVCTWQVLSATCDGEPIKPSDDRPATVLDRDVSGKRLAHLWQRLLQLDGSMLPQWQALLAAGST
jgi:hypothetical protein